jgi:phage-related minor tail protein
MQAATSSVNELSSAIANMEKDISLRVDTSQVQAAAAQVNALSSQLSAIAGKAAAAGSRSQSPADKPGMWDWLLGSSGRESPGGWTDSGSYAWQTGEMPSGGWTQMDLPGGVFARGGVFRGGNVVPFASGGIFNRPTLFPMARGYGLMGEAGPEAVMPLKRGRDGRLGVEASGGGVSFSPTINIIGTNKSPEQLAREIVKPLQAEMRRLELVSA